MTLSPYFHRARPCAPVQPRSRATNVALVSLTLAAPLTAHAAALNLSFTDTAGKPLLDAVALLEPALGKMAVKPLADVEPKNRS